MSAHDIGTLNTSAHYLLEGLVELDIEYIFSNFGTDNFALIEKMVRWRKHSRQHPKEILCQHENVAIHMAVGYAAITGRSQSVMVHLYAGTANATMGMHNMFCARCNESVQVAWQPRARCDFEVVKAEETTVEVHTPSHRAFALVFQTPPTLM